MKRDDSPQTPNTQPPTDSCISRLHRKIGQITKQTSGKPARNRYECYDYIHPDFGVLTIVLDHEIREIAAVSFTPTRNVMYKLVPSVDRWKVLPTWYLVMQTGYLALIVAAIFLAVRRVLRIDENIDAIDNTRYQELVSTLNTLNQTLRGIQEQNRAIIAVLQMDGHE